MAIFRRIAAAPLVWRIAILLVPSLAALGYFLYVRVADPGPGARLPEIAVDVIAVLGFGSLVWVAAVLCTALPGLRDLKVHANEISAGRLPPDPIRVRGPRAVQQMTGTMNEMSATLMRLDHQLARMASGGFDETPSFDVPGPLGERVRASVERLAIVNAQLRRNESFTSAIVNEAGDAIWTVLPDGSIFSANRAAERIVGRPADEQIGAPISTVLTATSGEGFVTTTGGNRVLVSATSNVVDVGEQSLQLVVCHDLTERSHYERQLEYQARHDALTGLPNRVALFDHLAERIVDAGDRVAVLFIDLDGFKQINDHHGHAAGDVVLREVGRRLEGTVGGRGMVARLGGDEFLAVVPGGIELDTLVGLGEELIDRIEDGVRYGEVDHHLSASVGVAVADGDSRVVDLLQQADIALYLAKRNGRGRVVAFDAALQIDDHATAARGKGDGDADHPDPDDEADDAHRADGDTDGPADADGADPGCPLEEGKRRRNAAIEIAANALARAESFMNVGRADDDSGRSRKRRR